MGPCSILCPTELHCRCATRAALKFQGPCAMSVPRIHVESLSEYNWVALLVFLRVVVEIRNLSSPRSREKCFRAFEELFAHNAGRRRITSLLLFYGMGLEASLSLSFLLCPCRLIYPSFCCSKGQSERGRSVRHFTMNPAGRDRAMPGDKKL